VNLPAVLLAKVRARARAAITASEAAAAAATMVHTVGRAAHSGLEALGHDAALAPAMEDTEVGATRG